MIKKMELHRFTFLTKRLILSRYSPVHFLLHCQVIKTKITVGDLRVARIKRLSRI